MSTQRQLPTSPGVAQWPVWSTTARVIVSEPEAIGPAQEIVQGVLEEVDRACSRFRPTSELRLVMQAGEPVTQVSPLLADLIKVALKAAEDTGGAVDPTIGNAIEALGYVKDIAEIKLEGGTFRILLGTRATWRDVDIDQTTLLLPKGMLLDLGATAKAYAADLSAKLIWQELRVGTLVSLGGDIATAGPAPIGDWQIRVRDLPGDPDCQISLPAGLAIATSSTQGRRWQAGGRTMHHIIDPWTHQPAPEVWKTVSVVADSCLRANTLSTAALVWGMSAPSRLRAERLPTRLVSHHGAVLLLGGWPSDSRLETLDDYSSDSAL